MTAEKEDALRSAPAYLPWWRRLWQRIDRWLYETQRLREMDEDRPRWDT